MASTGTALLPVFEFALTEHVREPAFEAWGQLCTACRAAGEMATPLEPAMEFMKHQDHKSKLYNGPYREDLADDSSPSSIASSPTSCSSLGSTFWELEEDAIDEAISAEPKDVDLED